MATEKQDVAYLNDLSGLTTSPDDAVAGHVPVFGADHSLVDSGRAPLVVDASLTESGAAADAAAVGASIAAASMGASRKVVQISGQAYAEKTTSFALVDQAVNIISEEIASGYDIILIPPSRPTSAASGSVLARDMYVYMSLTSASAVTVSVRSATLIDETGGSVSITVPANGKALFHLADTSREDSAFLLSGFGDHVYTAISDIERALDEILAED